MAIALGVDVVGNTDGLADGLSLGEEVVGMEVVGDTVVGDTDGLAEGLSLVGEGLGALVGIDVGMVQQLPKHTATRRHKSWRRARSLLGYIACQG